MQHRITTGERKQGNFVHIMITFQLIQKISHIITSQRSEQNIFNNIFTDKFKERVALAKANSGIV